MKIIIIIIIIIISHFIRDETKDKIGVGHVARMGGRRTVHTGCRLANLKERNRMKTLSMGGGNKWV